MPAENNKDTNIDNLALKAASGDDSAMSELIAIIMPYAKAKASVNNPGFVRISDDDLTQEGMFGFLDAVKKFNPERNVHFRAFAGVCIENRIKSALRSNSSSGNVALTTAVSIEDDEILKLQSNDPLSAFRADYMKKQLSEVLSDFENRILDMRLNGKKYSAMAAELGCSEKAIDNAIQRIKKKARKIL